MSGYLETLNEWISTHQPLVVSVGVPITTLLVTLLTSWFSNKRALANQVFERDLQRRIKIAEFRQAWINDLRDELSEFIAVTGLRAALDVNGDGKDMKAFMQSFALASKIQMRVNPKDLRYRRLLDALEKSTKNEMHDGLGSAHAALTLVGQEILKDEWDRLKSELVSIQRLEANP